ncbi:Response regulator receiver domain-containing protein [Mucilaginibacter gossypiicola]|uniref:Response regulator receiver domain-containing protein n=1 Tax=Mucilaginibacter gossypiicola TaxID=551995 RepID=A0A1H8ES89_9SPHI|nr:response regulator [Mucilaginibacter gossypiicola]SEN22236.1 Response regulator receiver domain-containing protein [Mucilaginibacter gossypiicola]
MQDHINGNCDKVSYFLVNKLKNIVSFHFDGSSRFSYFVNDIPQIGQNIVETFSPAIAQDISEVIDKFSSNNADKVAETFINKNFSNSLKINFLLFPISINEEIYYFVFIMLADLLSPQNECLKSYSKFTSHELRAPISNILSLANFDNYSALKSKKGSKLKELLTNIYLQAEKLNNIIALLNDMINPEIDLEEVFFYKIGTAKHIVIVDDDLIINKLHKAMLSKFKKNAAIYDFDNPQNALEYIYLNNPDLIFLDINMPEIDAWSFLRKLETYPFHSNVIIVSSSIDINDKIKARAHPFVKEFVTKPLTWDKLKTLF